MSTKINVIITEDRVYATYVETICYESKYSNEMEMWTSIRDAGAVAFSYACDFGSVIANRITRHDLKTTDDIFEYLKNNK